MARQIISTFYRRMVTMRLTAFRLLILVGDSLIFHLDTKFDKLPIDFSFGAGVGDHPNSGIVGLALLDISHSLPCKKVDVSLGLRIQQVINVTKIKKIQNYILKKTH